MSLYGWPVLYVLFLWWFSTGGILYLNNLKPWTYPYSVTGASAMLAGALVWLIGAREQTTAVSAYAGFTFGLLAWGWTQLTFYTGILTGPRKSRCAEHCGGVRHFWHAVQTSLYHELLAIALGGVIFAICTDGANRTALWTYVILWHMHMSAKVNAVLGVRNLNEQFFPPHLKYLGGFLKQRPMNALFPVSVTVATVVTVVFAERAMAATAPFDAVSYTFYAAILALGVIEHWFLVLPLPSAALWSWSIPSWRRTPDVQQPGPMPGPYPAYTETAVECGSEGFPSRPPNHASGFPAQGSPAAGFLIGSASLAGEPSSG